MVEHVVNVKVNNHILCTCGMVVAEVICAGLPCMTSHMSMAMGLGDILVANEAELWLMEGLFVLTGHLKHMVLACGEHDLCHTLSKYIRI